MSKPGIQDRTVADVFVDQLVAWGVRFVYGIPGGSILAFAEAVERSDKLQHILVRQESTAAFMASAYGKLTGRLGVCYAITGAGATNLITGLADAAWDHSPVLAVTGQVRHDVVGTDAFQEIDQYELFSSLTVYNEMLQSAEQTPELLMRAMRTALVRRGVAHIGLPRDLQSQECSAAVRPMGDLVPQSGPAPPDAIRRAAEVITKASRPVILAGRDAWDACDELAQLSHLIHAPVATTPAAKGVYDENDLHALGVLGRQGLPCSIEVFRQADLAILIGADIAEQGLIPDVPTVQIIPNALGLAEDLPIAASLEGDIALTLREMMERIQQTDRGDWDMRAEIQRAQCYVRSQDAVRSAAGRVHPREVIEALGKVLADDAVVAVDTGDVTYWYMQYFRAARQRTLMSAHLASMGIALPGALAAQLEYPDRQCLAICGDGGLGMAMADFTTAVKYQLPITVLLLNNNAYLRVTGEALEADLPPMVHSLVNPDFAGFAIGCGGYGIRVTHSGDLEDALRDALTSERPSLVEVLTDPEVLATPTLQT